MFTLSLLSMEVEAVEGRDRRGERPGDLCHLSHDGYSTCGSISEYYCTTVL